VTDAIDLATPRRVHIVGIGGAGMSAIATVLAEMGHRVSGSDAADSPVLERLRARGIDAVAGHDAGLVADTDVVAASTAIGADNPELAAARSAGRQVLRRAELLAAIAARRRTIAVAGTHGKTTTSAMLTLVLIDAGWRPSFVVGGELRQLGTGARWDDGEWFVVEADESDGTFTELPTEVALVTSIEPDHLEHWGGFEPLVAAFEKFVAAAPTRVVCGDDAWAGLAGEKAGAASYGVTRPAEIQGTLLERDGDHTRLRIDDRGDVLGELIVPVPGVHNARNALGAVATAVRIGVPFDAAAAAIARFEGVGRRFERRGDRDGVTYVDDYAHLPTEVRAMVETARLGGWSRVVCVFQPHRYSRTEALWRDFADAFVGVDELIVTGLYGAGEPAREGISGELVANAVRAAHPEAHVEYVPDRADLVARLRELLRPGDLCLTLGAGDLTTLPSELLES
jgi:UDP-N-acetylmuramate--alanine ligase